MKDIKKQAEIVLLDYNVSNYSDVEIFQHIKTKKFSTRKDVFCVDYNWYPKALYIVDDNLSCGEWAIDIDNNHVEKIGLVITELSKYTNYKRLLATNNKYLNMKGVPSINPNIPKEYIKLNGDIKFKDGKIF